MTQVRIDDLLASSPVDPATHLDPDRVRYYAELPDDLPPVVAFRTERGLILADGYHRAPSRLAGQTPLRPRSVKVQLTTLCGTPRRWEPSNAG